MYNTAPRLLSFLLVAFILVGGCKGLALSMTTEIHVCKAGTCRALGSDAVHVEIEELASAVGGCTVREIGCLGYCSQGPNALVQKKTEDKEEEMVFVKIHSLEGSINVVERATGKKPPLQDPRVQRKFEQLRAARAREYARSVFHWNSALRGLPEQASNQPSLRSELDELLVKAGFCDGIGTHMPPKIDNYSQWALESVTPVSKHSAVFRFTSKDIKRGTPHPRGRGRQPQPKTWHTTLLAEVGPNGEGPLPWIERDYTPVSTAKEWEQGRCDLLVKVYQHGAATRWLHGVREQAPMVWLSQPAKTLLVPTLEPTGSSFFPQSVLLLLAGTGVVALPQILAHRDPLYKLGLPSSKKDQLAVPIDVVVSCRDDDVLLLPQLAEWCRQGAEATGVRHCTLLLTASNAECTPFPDATGGDALEAEELLQGLPNVRVRRERLTATVVTETLRGMPKPCRVVVSGPDGFNSAARQYLAEVVDSEAITILSA